jgi:hypothetical protein
MCLASPISPSLFPAYSFSLLFPSSYSKNQIKINKTLTFLIFLLNPMKPRHTLTTNEIMQTPRKPGKLNQLRFGLRSSRMLHGVAWQLVTDVWEHPIDPTFRSQEDQILLRLLDP